LNIERTGDFARARSLGASTVIAAHLDPAHVGAGGVIAAHVSFDGIHSAHVVG
jgi:hypothetical protein